MYPILCGTRYRRNPRADRCGAEVSAHGQVYQVRQRRFDLRVIATGRNGKKAVFPMRWGFQIPGRSLLVNARSETAGEKPTFKESWEKHRCIIPA